MAITLRKPTAKKPTTPGKEVRISGSREMLVGRNGEINASSKEDLLRSISQLLTMAADGSLDLSDAKDDQEVTAEQSNQYVAAAYQDTTAGGKWAELGASMAGQVAESADREGFMRRLLVPMELAQGTIPRHRVKTKNVTAVVASSSQQVAPQFVRDKYIMAPEFAISANVRVDQQEINQSIGDIMEDKYYEALESVMVAEDRVWKKMSDNTVGVVHPLQYVAGSLSPAVISYMHAALRSWNIPAETILLAADYWSDIAGNGAFSAYLTPVHQYELIATGRLGVFLGMNILTDGFRQPNLKVLGSGEMYVVGSPILHGSYTDRGPVQSVEVNNYPEGMIARGWFFVEHLSMSVHNARSVIKAVRA